MRLDKIKLRGQGFKIRVVLLRLIRWGCDIFSAEDGFNASQAEYKFSKSHFIFQKSYC